MQVALRLDPLKHFRAPGRKSAIFKREWIVKLLMICSRGETTSHWEEKKMKQKNPPEDTYARDSFSFRRMSKWQLWSISIVVAVLVIVSIFYLY
jgi:hypothetical protein